MSFPIYQEGDKLFIYKIRFQGLLSVFDADLDLFKKIIHEKIDQTKLIDIQQNSPGSIHISLYKIKDKDQIVTEYVGYKKFVNRYEIKILTSLELSNQEIDQLTKIDNYNFIEEINIEDTNYSTYDNNLFVLDNLDLIDKEKNGKKYMPLKAFRPIYNEKETIIPIVMSEPLEMIVKNVSLKIFSENENDKFEPICETKELMGFYKGPIFDYEKSKGCISCYHSGAWDYKSDNAITSMKKMTDKKIKYVLLSKKKDGKNPEETVWGFGFGWN